MTTTVQRESASAQERSSLRASAALLLSMGAGRGALFIAFLLLARSMDTAVFGLFFLGYTTLTFVPLLLDFGIGQTFIRHIPFWRSSRPEFSRYLHWLFFVLKMLSVAVLAVFAWPAILVAARFMHLDNHRALLAVAIAGSGATILYDYSNSVFQVTGAFGRFELYLLLRNSLFLFAVGALIVLRPTILDSAVLLGIVALVNLLLFASALPYLSAQWKDRAGNFGEFRSSLLRYSRWLTVAAVCFALYRRMDVYFLSHFRPLREVGIYSVALVMVEPVAMISPALFAVFLPKLAADPSAPNIRRYLRLALKIGAATLGLIVVYAAALRTAFPWLKPEYRSALPVVAILLGATVLLIFWNMLSAALLASDRPDQFGRITLVTALLGIVGNWAVVPRYGLIGAAGVYGLSMATAAGLGWIAVGGVLRREEMATAQLRELSLGRKITDDLATQVLPLPPAGTEAASPISSEASL